MATTNTEPSLDEIDNEQTLLASHRLPAAWRHVGQSGGHRWYDSATAPERVAVGYSEAQGGYYVALLDTDHLVGQSYDEAGVDHEFLTGSLRGAELFAIGLMTGELDRLFDAAREHERQTTPGEEDR